MDYKGWKVGSTLKKLRVARGVKSIDLCDILSISKNGYSLYENNKGLPSLETLVKLASYFEVSLDYLVFGEDPNYNYEAENTQEVHERRASFNPQKLGIVEEPQTEYTKTSEAKPNTQELEQLRNHVARQEKMIEQQQLIIDSQNKTLEILKK